MLLVSHAKPVARHQVYHVKPGTEEVVVLKGFNADGKRLQAKITSLPLNGELYQLSHVFSHYGYDPKRASSPIREVPAVVTGSKNRIVFRRDALGGPPPHTKFAEFRYTLTDGMETSEEGIIVITADEALVTSAFDFGTEDWKILDNGKTAVPKHQPISRGNLLSYYIYASDSIIHHQENGDDAVRWTFSAPAKFLGNQWAAYGGSLDFVLFSSEGSFAHSNLNLAGNGNLVVMECSTCNQNKGVTVAMPLTLVFKFDGTITQFRLPLTEKAGWLKDPKNVLHPWTPPTQCELVSVLSALSSLRILGDFTQGHETVALDSVAFRHGPGFPLGCYAK